MRDYNVYLHGFSYRLRRISGVKRLALLLLVAGVLAHQTKVLILYLRHELVAYLAHGYSFDAQFNRVNNLIFFDVLVLVALVSGGLFLLSLLTGRPPVDRTVEGAGSRFFIPSLRGRPWLTFFIFAPLIALVLWSTPSWIANHVLYYDVHGVSMISFGQPPDWPNAHYVRAALLTAVCLAASFADLAASSATVHWWLLPLLFVPPSLAPVSLLWWNVAAQWAPSRLWSLWRPVFAAGTCLLPLLVFVERQPIRTHYLFYEGMHDPRVVRLDQPCPYASYEVIRPPGRPDLFLRCGPSLRQYRRSATKWDLVGDLDFRTLWNKAGFDFERHLAFVFLPQIAKIAVVDISRPPPRLIREVPTPSFSRMGDFISLQLILAVDAAHGILFVADTRGEIRAYDEQSLSLLKSVTMNFDDGAIAEMQFDARRSQLLVLQNQRLSILTTDLQITASRTYDAIMSGLTQDEQRNRLLIGLPERLQVMAVDRDSLREVARGDAPAGVRVLGLDRVRGYLFLTAMSGVVETRRADDFRLLGRTRLIPWIHGLEVFPEFGELMVTGGEIIPVMWRYEPPASRWNFFDQCLRLFEKLMREHFSELQTKLAATGR